MNRLARIALHHHRRVLLGVVAITLVAAAFGAGVRDRLSVGGFTDPGAESTLVDEALVEEFGAGPPNHFMVVSIDEEQGRIDDDRYEQAGIDLTEVIASEPEVTDVVSYWTLGELSSDTKSPLIEFGAEPQRALIAMRLTGDDNEQRESAERLATYTGSWGEFTVQAGGVVETSREAAEIAERDLATAELIAAPLTLLALVIAFRGWRAGLMPLAVAAVAVLGAFAILSLLASVIEVSIFAVNLTTALGLGLAIDYSLLVVARFREELAAGRTTDRALHRTLQTAGRTVVFSAGTVAASLVALLVFPFVYLRSFAYAGFTVVAVAATAALLILPCLLAWIGSRIGVGPDASTQGAPPFWERQSRRVIARPALWAAGALVLLVGLALPFLGFEPGRLDDRALPESAQARQATEAVREHFSWPQANPISVYPTELDPADAQGLETLRDRILETPSVYRVDSIDGFHTTPYEYVAPLAFNQRFVTGDHTWLSVVSLRGPEDPRHTDLVHALRDDGDFEVGGAVAQRIDTIAAVQDRLPLALAIIAVVTSLLLFMLTGSPLISLKAVILNLASLGATFGALVWVFQDGHLSDWLGFTPTGTLDIFTPILMFCIAFGLSMDYEVFVLARIKEEYDLSGSNDQAIVTGVTRTGPLVTTAAVILTIVFVAIGTSGVTVVKMLGLGLALAVVVDAFIVRATLTPALMALAGRWNWWAPRPLRRFHLRWGLWENEPVEVPQ